MGNRRSDIRRRNPGQLVKKENNIRNHPHLSRKPTQASGPERPDLEYAIVALFIEWELHLDGDRPSAAREKLQVIAPEGVCLGRLLHSSGELRAWQELILPAVEVFDRLGERL